MTTETDRLDPATGRPFGDHGTGSQAVDWVLNHSDDNDAYNQMAFLKAWQEGGAFDEWPEFYEWLATQNSDAQNRAISMIRHLVVELETWEPELLEVLQCTPQAALMREWLGAPRRAVAPITQVAA